VTKHSSERRIKVNERTDGQKVTILLTKFLWCTSQCIFPQ